MYSVLTIDSVRVYPTDSVEAAACKCVLEGIVSDLINNIIVSSNYLESCNIYIEDSLFYF